MTNDMTLTGLREFLNQAKRLGMIPSYRYGTVQANSGTNPAILMVVLDGDDTATRVYNTVGAMSVDSRVFTVSVPPHGVYAIGAIGNTAPREQYRTSRENTAQTNLTTAVQTLPGTSITVTGVPAGAYYKGEVSADFQAIGTTSTTGVVQMFIDGVAASSQNAIFTTVAGTATSRGTTGQTFNNFPGSTYTGLTNLAGGTHVFDLRAFRSGGADGNIRVNNIHTTLTLTLYW